RAVAAEIARIAPQLPVRVKILRREEIPRKRLDARRRFAGARRPDELSAARKARADRLESIDVVLERRRSADAVETDVCRLLCCRHGAGEKQHGYRGSQALVH